MQQKHKLSKADKIALNQLAGRLPWIFILDADKKPLMQSKYLRGRALTNHQKSNIKNFKPNSYYVQQVNVYRNPYNFLEKAYLENGNDGVSKAITQWISDAKAQKELNLYGLK